MSFLILIKDRIKWQLWFIVTSPLFPPYTPASTEDISMGLSLHMRFDQGIQQISEVTLAYFSEDLLNKYLFSFLAILPFTYYQLELKR